MVCLINFLSLTFFFYCLLLNDFALGGDKACVGSKLVNLVIIADAFQEERALRNFELKETMEKRSGEWRFSRVHSEEDIQKALQLNQGECINTMIVSGLHTRWDNGNLKTAVRYGDGGQLIYQEIDFDSAFQTDCMSPNLEPAPLPFSSFAFRDRKDQCNSSDSKFAKNALIAFDSCHLAQEENPTAIFKRLRSLLKLENAAIYANYTYGVAHPSNLLAVPCYEGTQGALVKSVRTILQAAWPFTLVVGGSMYAVQNKGFLATVNGEEITYIPSKFQEAIKSPEN
jgi:hypothetical protein